MAGFCHAMEWPLFLPSPRPSPDLKLYTDSSGSIGYGAYCQGSWFNGHWSQEQLHHSIQWKELYPIVLAVCVWGRRWTTLRIRLHCDNQAIVHCLNSGTSHCPHIMVLLRSLFLLAAKHNLHMSAQHICCVCFSLTLYYVRMRDNICDVTSSYLLA